MMLGLTTEDVSSEQRIDTEQYREQFAEALDPDDTDYGTWAAKRPQMAAKVRAAEQELADANARLAELKDEYKEARIAVELGDADSAEDERQRTHEAREQVAEAEDELALRKAMLDRVDEKLTNDRELRREYEDALGSTARELDEPLVEELVSALTYVVDLMELRGELQEELFHAFASKHLSPEQMRMAAARYVRLYRRTNALRTHDPAATGHGRSSADEVRKSALDDGYDV